MSVQSIYDVPAPGKINLFLHINGRRDDGYHLIQSVFLLLDWCDTLHFESSASPDIVRTDLGHPSPNALLPAVDLTVKAAKLLQAATGVKRGARISLLKQLPTEAGMGGGSSDAASCLLALNRLWGTGLSRAELMKLGLQLGADVPFFLLGQNAWVEGIGERLTPVELPERPYVIVKPPDGLPTALIFNDQNLNRDTKRDTIQGFAEHSNSQTLFGKNDLQPVAQAHCKAITACIDWLKDMGLNARMTGSGSAVFAPGRLADKHPPHPADWVVNECSSLTAHPLKDWAI
jgi:4-diphosphocytidyl-2-C-methyl-D-erythritol kinase